MRVLILFIGGGLGHLGIQFAKAKGMKIVGIDARDEGIALSKEMGADVVVDARKDKEEVIKQVMQATGGEGCYATINVSDAKSAAALACTITKVHGKMVRQASMVTWGYSGLTCVLIDSNSTTGRSCRTYDRTHLPGRQNRRIIDMFETASTGYAEPRRGKGNYGEDEHIPWLAEDSGIDRIRSWREDAGERCGDCG